MTTRSGDDGLGQERGQFVSAGFSDRRAKPLPCDLIGVQPFEGLERRAVLAVSAPRAPRTGWERSTSRMGGISNSGGARDSGLADSRNFPGELFGQLVLAAATPYQQDFLMIRSRRLRNSGGLLSRLARIERH